MRKSFVNTLNDSELGLTLGKRNPQSLIRSRLMYEDDGYEDLHFYTVSIFQRRYTILKKHESKKKEKEDVKSDHTIETVDEEDL